MLSLFSPSFLSSLIPSLLHTIVVLFSLSPAGVPLCGFLSLLSFPDFVILYAAWKLVVLLSVDWFDERPPIYRQKVPLVVSIPLLSHSF